MTAAGLPGVSVVSMSFTAIEWSGETAYDSDFTTPAGHQGVTFLASTDDYGSPAGYPATSPNVVAVGGTSLFLNPDNSYNSETGWSKGSDSWSPTSAGAGGISAYEPVPAYQAVVDPSTQPLAGRATPDGERSERIGPLERGFSSATRSFIIVVSRHTRRKEERPCPSANSANGESREDPTATAGSPRRDPGRDPGRPAADRDQTPRWARDPHRRRLPVLGARHRDTDQSTVGPPDGRGDASRPRRRGEPAPGPLLGSRGGPHDQGSRPTRRHAPDDVRRDHRPGELLQPQL